MAPTIVPVAEDAGSIIRAHIMPMLEQELVRLQSKCDRRALDGRETHKLVELTRAVVALRYVDIRVAEGEQKRKGAENLEGMSVEELLAKAKQLLQGAGINANDLRALSAFRAGGKG